MFSVCRGAPVLLEGSHGKVVICCRAVEPRREPFKGFAWYFWIVWLSLLSFLTVWGKRRELGEQLVLNWSSGERLVSATPPAVWAALQLQSILPYKFTTDSQWQVLARYTSAVLCMCVCVVGITECVCVCLCVYVRGCLRACAYPVISCFHSDLIFHMCAAGSWSSLLRGFLWGIKSNCRVRWENMQRGVSARGEEVEKEEWWRAMEQ